MSRCCRRRGFWRFLRGPALRLTQVMWARRFVMVDCLSHLDVFALDDVVSVSTPPLSSWCMSTYAYPMSGRRWSFSGLSAQPSLQYIRTALECETG
jgi:hypothetical protein